MKINLESPFKEKWNSGYLRTHKESGRKLLDLFSSNRERTTTTYARYLKCVELGYELSHDYEVDHINTNCTDDNISNLQILTKEEHRIKSISEQLGRNIKQLICECCGNSFEREVYNIKAEKRVVCSRKCNGKMSTNISPIRPRLIDHNLGQRIKDYREAGLSDYQISSMININRATIQRYRKEKDIK